MEPVAGGKSCIGRSTGLQIKRHVEIVAQREASQLVINRLNQLGPLPNGAQPFLSPASPIGQIYRYRVVGPPAGRDRRLLPPSGPG